ncbi:MAG: aldo/keto reductase [Abitibacteriaceae bacterium]|nr:aldo/keto reductase [Abditibacteriaceae bacterium]MBV9866651.1 aldo/keto reductase [Abditibacteriaceae bacterium]
MLHRTLGKTGWSVSTIGLGAWGIGGQWGHIEHSTAMETIQAAFGAGINFFDTADAYGEPPGLSEERIGEALHQVRDRIFIATKVGNFARRSGHALSYETPLHVELCCDASLHRLRTDYIDLYQCHIADLKQPDIFLEAFHTLFEKGKIRAFGISTNSVEVAQAFNRGGKCAAVQLDYSYLNRSPEKELLPYCQANNIGTIIRGPLAQGIAAGKFTHDTVFTDSVRKSWNEGAGHEKFLQRLEIVEQLRFLDRADRNMAQAALQFVISHPAVTTAIPGAKSPQQALANAAAGATPLGDEEMEQVRSIAQSS